MEKQEPDKVLIQFLIETKYKKALEESPEYHKGLTAHLARKGFIKEIESFLNQELELKAS
jgi:hypothetical protein